MSDWHYEKRKDKDYPSVRFFQQKGFRVLPSGWQPLDATLAFSAFAKEQKDARLLGYLCTTWGKARIPNVAEWPPVTETLKQWK